MTTPTDATDATDESGVPTRAQLDRYQVPSAPADFAARMAARVAERAPPTPAPAPRRRRTWAVLAAALSAAAAVAVAVVVAGGGSGGHLDKRSGGSAPATTAHREHGRYREQPAAEQPGFKNLPSGGSSAAPYGVHGNLPPSARVASVESFPAHDAEAYARIDDNPFHTTAADPLSTFSVDVDTASYANVRRFVGDGQLPPKDAVRIEELVNYFRYAYPQPAPGEPAAIVTDVATSPWNPRYRLVRIGVQAPAIDAARIPARNLVFLLDVSGSMSAPDKLPLLKQAMGLLVDTLRPQDKVAIVVYAGASGVALPATSGADKDAIRAAIARLEPGGSTNGASGIQLAYDLAEASEIAGGINRVILCTDGDFNVGVTSDGELTRLIERERERGTFLTVLGFGRGNVKDATMERLADRGNGNYGYIDSLDEARKLLVKEAGATLVTVAKDVKLQVEFNPATVAGYRLIGYENRLLAAQDFNDDTKDAGELGSGHTVTALYELVPAGEAVPTGAVDPLKYQTPPAPAGAGGELLTVKLRYKAPDGGASKLLARAVVDQRRALADVSADFRWAVAIAGFGMLLRESPYRGDLSWSQVQAMAAGAVGDDVEGYRTNALAVIEAASRLARRP